MIMNEEEKLPWQNDYTKKLTPRTYMRINDCLWGNHDYKRPELKEFEEKLREFEMSFRHIAFGGYNSATFQSHLSVRFDRGKGFAKQYAEIKKFIPYHLPTPENKERECTVPSGKVIGVFEHTLSENGSYNIVIVNENESYLIKWVYHHPRILKKGTQDEIFKYVWENHWYEDSARKRSDD